MTSCRACSAAASSAFSVAITDGSSMKTSPARRPPGARSAMSRVVLDGRAERAEGVEVRIEAPAADDVAAGRRHARAPEAREQRAGEQERRADALGQVAVDDRVGASRSAAHSDDLVVRRQSTRTPSASSSASIVSTSRIRGTLRTTTSSSVRTEAARIGRAPFLLPAGTIVPDSGAPPSMTNFSMRGCLPAARAGPEGWARVTAMPARISRDEAWSLLDGVGPVAVAAPPLPGGRDRDARLRRARRRTTPSCGASPACCTTPTTSASRTWTTPSTATRARSWPSSSAATPRRRWSARSPRTPTSSASRRESPMERTLVAVDELCGFLVACAQVRPEGIHGLTPKSVKKKLKQPSFAAAVNRDDVRGGAEQLGVDFDEHIALRRSPRSRRARTSSSCTGTRQQRADRPSSAASSERRPRPPGRCLRPPPAPARARSFARRRSSSIQVGFGPHPSGRRCSFANTCSAVRPPP